MSKIFDLQVLYRFQRRWGAPYHDQCGHYGLLRWYSSMETARHLQILLRGNQAYHLLNSSCHCPFLHW